MWKEDGGLVRGSLFAGESLLLIRYASFRVRATIYDVLAS